MADQTFGVLSGFYDAVNNDRVYTADDMNKPYKRIVSNGVFAMPTGTPSDDLQVLESSGLTIKVNKGEGIFADKWFENPNVIYINVPKNTNVQPRIDSVIIQIDKRLVGRVGNIVYRTGTPAAYPEAPEINTESDIVEYRLANVRVNAGVNTISQARITDLRGSESCPWVTAIIDQVDTSTLFKQWQTAYKEYFAKSTEDWKTYENYRREEWDDFFGALTEDLTLSTNVITITSKYITESSTDTIPVGIVGYNADTDILHVYINGLYADATRYTYNSGSNTITLINAVPAGQVVDFVCFKSIITGDMSSVGTLVQAINDRITELHQDSGWLEMTLENSAEAFNANLVPSARRIGETVYVRGAVKNVNTVNDNVFTLPVSMCPSKPHIFSTNVLSKNTVVGQAEIMIQPDGACKLFGKTGTISPTYMVGLCTSFLID